MFWGELGKVLWGVLEGVISMFKKIYEFNDIIWKFCKELFGKGFEWIYIVFVENMVVLILYGNLSVSE